MTRLLAGLLTAVVLTSCVTMDCGWVVELIDDEAHLTYRCAF